MADDRSENDAEGKTCAEIYAAVFPYYLTLGCSYEKFWFAPAWIAASYYEAEIWRREQRNYEAWRQGLYFNNALRSALSEFSWGLNGRKGARPDGYLEYPFAFTEREKEAEKQRSIEYTRKFFEDGQKQ